jgi:hypothetical protein
MTANVKAALCVFQAHVGTRPRMKVLRLAVMGFTVPVLMRNPHVRRGMTFLFMQKYTYEAKSHIDSRVLFVLPALSSSGPLGRLASKALSDPPLPLPWPRTQRSIMYNTIKQSTLHPSQAVPS